jgi:transposase
MMTKERQTYDKEFKQKAVELSFARGNAREIAEELGIHPELLYRWRRETRNIRIIVFRAKGGRR